MTRAQLEHVIRASAAIASVEGDPGGFPHRPGRTADFAGSRRISHESPGKRRPDRLIPVTGTNTRDARGWCLEVHDLAIAEYVAGGEKDLFYTRALAQHEMTERSILTKWRHFPVIERDAIAALKSECLLPH